MLSVFNTLCHYIDYQLKCFYVVLKMVYLKKYKSILKLMNELLEEALYWLIVFCCVLQGSVSSNTGIFYWLFSAIEHSVVINTGIFFWFLSDIEHDVVNHVFLMNASSCLH